MERETVREKYENAWLPICSQDGDGYSYHVIAYRLSTIINSDRILFLNNGKIESEGTHKELLKKSKNYRNLYKLESIK